MLCAKSNRIGRLTVLAIFGALLILGRPDNAVAQEPPTSIPAGGPPHYDPNAIAFNSWLFYPAVNFFAENSNNYFMTQPKLNGWAFGVTPNVTAEWSNGIHTTTLFGKFQDLQYPPDNAVPQASKIVAVSDEATWTQQYAPLRDLIFTAVGDYTHQTLQSGLTNSIPNPVAFSGTVVLPNGNIQLPNGTIISPTGQVVGQASATPSVGTTATVNPFDVFTATAGVQKLFPDGIVNLGASIAWTDYDRQGSANFNSKTFTESGSYALGPFFYFYSNGAYSIRDTDGISGDTTAYRIIGGIGTRQFGLFTTTAYFGHQGSGASGSGSAGGNVYGAKLNYLPTRDWTMSISVDETLNLAPANGLPSTQALGIGGFTPLQVAVSSSTQITSTTFQSSYTISPQWTVNALFGFTRIENLGSPIWDDSYVADATLRYDIWRNLTLTWEYQFSSIVSNAPGTSLNRNLFVMSANYRF